MGVNRFLLAMNSSEAAEFLEIGRMLASEKDTTKLFEKIISSGMHMTQCEFGAVYLIIDQSSGKLSSVSTVLTDASASDVKDTSASNMTMSSNLLAEQFARMLRNKSLLLAFSKGRELGGQAILQVRPDSIEGHVIITGEPLALDDVYKIDPALGISFDRNTDRQTGYRSKSFLCVPMKDHSGNIAGLIEFINRKDENGIISFTAEDRTLVNSIAGQATTALENIRLYRETQDLLESYKKQNSRLEDLSRRIMIAHEEERKRIAREIHDGPAQSTASLAIKLGIIRKLFSCQEYEKLESELKTFADSIKSTVSEIRTIIYDLRPTVLEDGLKAALLNRISTFRDTTGIETDLKLNGDDSVIPYYLSYAVYKVVQEALTNIGKHSAASSANIRIDILEDSLKAVITDNGKGFDSAAVSKRKHSVMQDISEKEFGLQGMKERIELVKGVISIDSAPGKGTRIKISIPIISIPLDR